MSYDRQIDQVCPHLVVEEALYLSSDRMTIRPLRPISSLNSVTVRLNGQIEVPSMGVALPASSMGLKEGPFTIVQGVNDIFAIAVKQGATQTVTLPAGSKIPAERVAALFNAAFQGVLFSVMGNKLAFKTLSDGRGASVFVKSTSTLAATLGIQTNREFRGQQNVPGWTLIGDPSALADRPTRLIVFDDPLRSGSCHVEIGYSTIRQECRRCGGTGVENDFRYSNDGEPVVIRDEALLLQELQKDFYTIRGTNPFHTWSGTALLETIGKKLSAGGFVQNLIVSDIYQAFNRWQSIKRQQEERAGQFVSDAEFPFRLLSVDLQQSTQDPTVVFVSITVQNRSNTPIQLERGLRIPQPTDLLGSTAQQGVIRQSLSNYVLTG
jgi:hypothetical protein